MAVVDRITDQAAGTRVNTGVGDGYIKTVRGLITPAADDSANSVFRAVRVPSNAKITSVKVSAADATTAGAINVGVYRYTDAGDGAVVDADLFASAFDLAGGPYARQEVVFESGEYTYAESVQPLWQAAGLTEDPHGYLVIAATVSTTFNGGPTAILFEVDYVE